MPQRLTIQHDFNRKRLVSFDYPGFPILELSPVRKFFIYDRTLRYC